MTNDQLGYLINQKVKDIFREHGYAMWDYAMEPTDMFHLREDITSAITEVMKAQTND